MRIHTFKPARGTRLLALTVAGVLSLSALAACGSGDSAEQPKENKISAGEVPDYYPSDYSKLIDEAKKEGGTLTIYSNTDQENWAPIFRDFQAAYPWITTISANNLDSDEVFQRTLSETATGGSPADVLVSNAAQAWAEYAQTPNALTAYT